MPKIKYQDMKFGASKLAKIERANSIIKEYSAQNLDLTLRQIFYQFVSRGFIANNNREYKNLGTAISDARLAGLIDWDTIVDRTRYLRSNSHWSTPQSIVKSCATQYRVDKWADQPCYVEVFIEKDALVGVIEGVCRENDVPYLACRGYTSVSEIWKAGHARMRPKIMNNKSVIVLYLGDHDPSGIDMTRDVRDRLNTFIGDAVCEVDVRRLALNMDQVQMYNPPPNPTKMSDTRSGPYYDEFGDECWELDALDPVVIRDLIQAEIDSIRVDTIWEASVARENKAKVHLASIADNWEDVLNFL